MKENKNLYQKILENAKIILNNTNSNNSFYLQQDLELFIEDFSNYGYDTDFIELLDVFEYIATDGFDVTDFELYEIPHPSVYSFYNKTTNQMFDICINNFCNYNQKTYAAYLNKNKNQCYANNITEAIEKYN